MSLGGLFAILAAIVFAVGLFGGHIGGLNLLFLGLMFLALAHVFGHIIIWRRD